MVAVGKVRRLLAAVPNVVKHPERSGVVFAAQSKSLS
jgi:hypothetical protein